MTPRRVLSRDDVKLIHTNGALSAATHSLSASMSYRPYIANGTGRGHRRCIADGIGSIGDDISDTSDDIDSIDR